MFSFCYTKQKMDLQILIGLLLTVLPIVELRGGLPVIVEWAVRNKVSVWPWFILVLFLNILVIFFIFAFLDFLHERFMGFRWYSKFMGGYLKKIEKKSEKIMKKMENWGFVALALFVAIPLPGTGAWTGSFVAWFLKLNRIKSIIAISIGVIIAGTIILLASLGFFNSIY